MTDRPTVPGDRTRRRLLVGLAGMVGLAGCVSGSDDTPEPEIVWYETAPDIAEVRVQRSIEVTAMVANFASAGTVEVVAQTRATGREEPLDTHSLTVDLDESEQRQFGFEMVVSPAADLLDVRAQPA